MSVVERMLSSSRYRGNPMGTTPEHLGELRRSDDALEDVEELRARMEEDGYLFLPGLLNRDEVMDARMEIMRRLGERGVLVEDRPLIDGVGKPAAEIDPRATGSFMPLIAKDNPPLAKVIYDGPMMAFYERFFGEPVRHFDYTWFRVKLPGRSDPTTPHYDNVYMSRGSRRLLTSWTPFGDVPIEMGGLMLYEGSHRVQELVTGYGATDVDLYCENRDGAEEIVAGARGEGRELTPDERKQITWNSTGAYASDAVAVREELGTRLLSADYEAGDLLVFRMHMMHCSSDNLTEFVRVSSDSRYQPASDPADERWIGEDPPAHGIRAKRGMVC